LLGRFAGVSLLYGVGAGRHLMGLEEDRPTNLRSRAHRATWWATVWP